MIKLIYSRMLVRLLKKYKNQAGRGSWRNLLTISKKIYVTLRWIKCRREQMLPPVLLRSLLGKFRYKSDKIMIDKQLLQSTVEEAIAGSDLFLVDIKVSSDNTIVVEVDSKTGVDIDACVAITKKIESVFDRDVEDYELEVGSAGLTAPFKVKGQYEKNIGNEVEILTKDGKKFSGRLVAVGDDDFTVEVAVKVKPEGAKRPIVEQQPQILKFDDCKRVSYKIDFK